jgi:ketosteroid isomerase-like protein
MEDHPNMPRTTSIAIVLISLLAAVPSQAQSVTQSKDPAVIEAVKQVEESMGKAMVNGDIEKLKEIYADDFAVVGSDGKMTTKQNLVSDFASFHDKLEWYENGPIDVQVFGSVAVAQGFVKEKRSRNGKDSSGQFLWQDLLKEREGKWVVVRSAAARVVLADSSKAQSPRAQFKDPTLVDTIRQFEQTVGDAMVAADVDKLNQMYADDWSTVGSDGEIFTKENLLSDFKSGKHKLVSFKTGPMDVQVLGDAAVVQASVNEKRIQDGKDISGQFVFIDLLKKRGGRWVIVRTSGAKPS